MTIDLTAVETALHEAAQEFAQELIAIVLHARASELVALRTLEPPQAAPAVEVPATPATPPRRKRPWPTCTVEGCHKNVYMPSGALKVCYGHHLEAGGRPTPLAKFNAERSK